MYHIAIYEQILLQACMYRYNKLQNILILRSFLSSMAVILIPYTLWYIVTMIFPDIGQTVTISQTSVSAVTGDVLNLTCNPASSIIGSYSFVWKRNGMDVFAGNFAEYFTSFPFGTNSTLVFNPPIQNLSGLYSCVLSDTPSASASANVSIAPGKTSNTCTIYQNII